MTIGSWIKRFFNGSDECRHFEEIMDLVIDGEATAKQEEFFKEHISKCLPCLDRYNIDKEFKRTLREKIEKKAVPWDLIDQIRQRVSETA